MRFLIAWLIVPTGEVNGDRGGCLDPTGQLWWCAVSARGVRLLSGITKKSQDESPTYLRRHGAKPCRRAQRAGTIHYPEGAYG